MSKNDTNKLQSNIKMKDIPASRLKKVLKDEIAPKMMEQFKYKSVMEVPRFVKIVVNMGVSTAKGDKALESSIRDLAQITGQKPIVTIAKKSVATFKVREGMQIGCKVTLRGDRALYFFDQLISVAIPRIRDFQGLSPKSFDGRGNYSLGLHEQLVFPEIPYDTFDGIRGMDITFCTTARNDEESRAFFKHLGLPLKEK